MAPGISSYLIVFGVATGVSLVTTPLMRCISEHLGFMVEPDARRVHERSTALLGGVAMFVGFAAAMGAAWLMSDFDVVFATASEPVGIVIAGLVMLVFGTYDDVREMSAPAKVATMVLAGSVLAFAGVTILNLRLPVLGVFILSQDLAFVVTVLWLLAIVNAVNLIDGLDGLAAGIVAIAGITFFVHSIKLSDEEVLLPNNIGPLVAIIASGIALGFLPQNFHRATIFMGDGGALFLGTLLVVSTVSVGGRSSEPFTGQTYFLFAPMLIPLIILAVPVVDVVWTVLRRTRARTSITAPDKEHMHHRLMRLGHGHRRSVLILWLFTALMSTLVLYSTYTGGGEAIMLPVAAVLVLMLYTVFHPVLRRRTS
ncbi:MAG: undecaprenyl/decaprenyl-phosphate alpha-N-acetylglucosaminyl 1-phosphate transferase [Acidimicrobiia bacterium]|nr:undecaprenyl/decaprenyl-phosphate alpha-N-acetylglucosaminyl 1-phosphate transferase [Acidimicrobiia bacterium]MYC57166.1 undecaprenyl/decaprenyl-phosphate alpha-N-acetylglucosaminyl 1-phosphate transferase [Acidimicrobiia bacterium]MYG93907.1 undecaprenyl/decaprenyl-phosphate alpha-N-acetylglucosaminyl 1-phosphate transferase [Acidimicrobiia bacterium]MYI29910.1 undecaprenyl/decaprenyl-phosphate alpha-N-acetylglucosaminyl 1-phosphate transferase [Acidimicrobiia bacterium]